MEDTRLESSPDLIPLYAKAVAGGVLPGGGGELPDKRFELPDVELDRGHLAAYERVCGFRVGHTLPATYLHVVAFPLSMKLMTEREFPFALLGLVHVANEIEQRRPLKVTERPSVRVWAENLRPHPKGRQLDMMAEAELDGEVVWRDRSTYLRRGDGDESAEEKEPGGSPPDPSAEWRVPGDIGRRYADVSGDRNPIHLNGIAAKVFGFPGAIAHGMWMKARCLAALEGRLPAAHRVEVAFKAPLKIPGKPRFGADRDGGGWRFALVRPDGERPHLLGAVDPLP